MILWKIFLDSLRPELSNDIYSPNGGRSLIKRVSEPGVDQIKCIISNFNSVRNKHLGRVINSNYRITAYNCVL